MTESDIRPPAVAGQFYPDDPAELRAMVEEYLAEVDATPVPLRAAVAPHAGLVYSGRSAAHVFKRTAIPPTVVILAPNHTGRLGAAGGASLWSHVAFETPFGPIAIDGAFAEQVEARCPLAAHDRAAHLSEHAIEVELPFLQLLAPGSMIVPLVLAWADWARCEVLAKALADVVTEWPGDVLLLGSSDMTHYEPADRAAEKDRHALQAVEQLDGDRLLEVCETHRVSMCGRGPAATVVEAARRLGSTTAEVVDYRHSGWVTGDDSSVVAYAGIVVP